MSEKPGAERAPLHGLVQRWAPHFRAYDAAEPVAAGFRARQLQAVLRLTPLTMLANLLNVLIVAAAFWPVGPRPFLVGWCLAIILVAAWGTRVWWRSRRGPPWRTASPQALQRATRSAALLALLWALMPLVLFPGADGERQLLVATITTGMMCAGGFALATTPAAGTAYVLILGAGAAGALFRADFPLAWPVGTLLLLYALIVVASVWSTARLFGARLMAEAEAERQNEVIGLLLRDFEENSSDVLWEIDAASRLCHVSQRLVALLGLPAAQLSSVSVVDVLQRLLPEGDAAAGQLAAIRHHLDAGSAFRDLPLATQRGRQTRWWSLSAKPLRDAGGRCTGWRGVASDITDAQRANEQLTWLAHFDPLTGLANRHQLRSQLASLLAPAFGAPRPLAVLCLDLDHFKTINDTMGHAVGDALLQAVAERLRARTRRSDTVARLGGDEFAVILHDVASATEAQLLTQRLLDGLQAPCEVQGAHIAVRTSVGVALAPKDGSDVDTLLNNADLALYAAKSAGRGELRFFAPQMGALTRRRMLIDQELRGALERREMSLEFQPQVALRTREVIGFEALLRWQHPELGVVSPAEFVPVAEESGLIGALGRWVLGEACRQAARWPAPLTVSVNVSPVQAMSLDLCQHAVAALQASGLPAQRLELEITESIFLQESQTTMRVLAALRDAGLRVALDDFGTGYSSLAYLRRFPFDTLKIDRSFVRELPQRRDARAIVKMIIGLAQTLQMQVVAEGVEHPAQASLLQTYGCGAIQGYLMARPMPADAVPAYLADLAAAPPLPWPDAPPTAPMPLDLRHAGGA